MKSEKSPLIFCNDHHSFIAINLRILEVSEIMWKNNRNEECIVVGGESSDLNRLSISSIRRDEKNVIGHSSILKHLGLIP